MENSEKDTLPNLQTVIDAINGLRLEMNEKIDGLRLEMNERFNSVEQRLMSVENDIREIKEMQFVLKTNLTDCWLYLINPCN